MKFNSNLVLNQFLNPEQIQAVRIIDKPLLIIAGPGTGKTKTLVAKIANLIIEKNINPNRILALTFTKKAAFEIKDRLVQLIKDGNNLPIVGTFHSWAFELLKQIKPDIKIISENQRLNILKKIKKDLKIKNRTVKTLSLDISRQKQEIPRLVCAKIGEEILKIYQNELKKYKWLDFDDLLIQLFRFIRLGQIKPAYDYIFVDEFQDTNLIQFELLKLLKCQLICAIGDPLQSIYSFRGSNEKIFNIFKNDFPDCLQVTLKNNYRSVRQIIDFSHNIFPGNIKTKSQNKNQGSVIWLISYNEFTEADWILTKINQLIGGTEFNKTVSSFEDERKLSFKDFAVIYRLHSLSRILKQKFDENGIPYQIIGGQSIYEKKEIKLIISCLGGLFNPNDQDFLELTQEFKINVADKQRLLNLDKNLKLIQLIEAIIETTQLRQRFEKQTKRLENLQQFISQIMYFDQEKDGLQKFLAYINYLKEHEYYDQNADKVTLLTMHAAKGLEFSQVFICGVENGLIPFYKNEDQNEEKRLFYVACSRAKQNLYLISCQYRFRKICKPSLFKKEMKSDYYQDLLDDSIEKIAKRKIKQKQKKAQMNLF